MGNRGLPGRAAMGHGHRGRLSRSSRRHRDEALAVRMVTCTGANVATARLTNVDLNRPDLVGGLLRCATLTLGERLGSRCEPRSKLAATPTREKRYEPPMSTPRQAARPGVAASRCSPKPNGPNLRRWDARYRSRRCCSELFCPAQNDTDHTADSTPYPAIGVPASVGALAPSRRSATPAGVRVRSDHTPPQSRPASDAIAPNDHGARSASRESRRLVPRLHAALGVRYGAPGKGRYVRAS